MNLEQLGQLVDDAELLGPDRLTNSHQWMLVEVAKVLWTNLTYTREYAEPELGSILMSDLEKII